MKETWELLREKNGGGRVREKGPGKGNSQGNILRRKDHGVPCNGEEARAGKVRG